MAPDPKVVVRIPSDFARKVVEGVEAAAPIAEKTSFLGRDKPRGATADSGTVVTAIAGTFSQLLPGGP